MTFNNKDLRTFGSSLTNTIDTLMSTNKNNNNYQLQAEQQQQYKLSVISAPLKTLYDTPPKHQKCIQNVSKEHQNMNNEYYVQPTPFRPTIRSFKHKNTSDSDKLLNEMRISENTKWFAFYNKDYISSMPNITIDMRHKLIDWMVDVHSHFGLASNALFLGICLVDRVLANFRDISHSKLQLIGCCCLWIAIKNHEKCSPEIRDFIGMCGGSITDSNLVQIEQKIQQIFGCDFSLPTVDNYIKRYTDIALAYALRSGKSQQLVKHFMMFCVEYGCVSYDLCLEKPSKLAAAVFIYVCLGLKVFTEQQFIDDKMFKIIGYEIEELFSVLRVLHSVVLRDLKSRRFSAIRDKYQSRDYSFIWIICKIRIEYFMKSDGNGSGSGRGYGWQQWQKKQ